MAKSPKKNKRTKLNISTNKKSKSKKPILAIPYILLEPDRPDIWDKAGFLTRRPDIIYKQVTKTPLFASFGFVRKRTIVYVPQKNINLYLLYYAEGECEYYSAAFFGGVIHTQLIPTIDLPDFLERQIKIDAKEGKFYDLINLRENSREMWGHGKEYGGEMFSNTAPSAEHLLENLMQYKRKGELINEGGAYRYIQVCYIQLA